MSAVERRGSMNELEPGDAHATPPRTRAAASGRPVLHPIVEAGPGPRPPVRTPAGSPAPAPADPEDREWGPMSLSLRTSAVVVLVLAIIAAIVFVLFRGGLTYPLQPPPGANVADRSPLVAIASP